MIQQEKILIVVGGGAAGFFCAVNAARLNKSLKVIIVEKSSKLLSKVKVSGGGRCNVTHACFEINELVKRYPRGQNFLKKAFHWFYTKDTVQWFKDRGVTLKTEADGRMFPVTNHSETIINCLVKEANLYGVEILMNCDIVSIHKQYEQFILTTNSNKQLTANYVCVAAGGHSKAASFDWLQQLGHSIETPVPSLFTFNIPSHPITQLMGVAVNEAIVKINGSKLQQQGPVLITHWGLSGPAVLKLSAWAARDLAVCNYHFSATVNWLTDYSEHTLQLQWPQLRQQYASQRIGHKNPFALPQRLWLYLLQHCSIKEEQRWADLTSKQQNQLIKTLTAQVFDVKGKTTFKEEFVTCGGIQLNEIDANTMQSKLVDRLFFAGEIMNVDGITGGFNFQHAWTSGWIAATTIATLSSNQ
ncbi:MAG: NAD(P)/FAD-dependent oxidoreductase [Bacteroidota bacterium]|nr:NAD(P)/FAD-dependent oxidoreductase [Bacteroidota bacterium]